MKKIKILYMIPALGLCDGIASYTMNYYRNIDKTKFQIDFIVAKQEENKYFEEIRSSGGNIYYIPKVGLKDWKAINQIKEFFKRNQNQYDIFHCHAMNLGVFYLYYAKKYGIKVRILHSHATKSSDKIINRIRNDIMRPFSVRNANYYFACSKLAGKALFKNKEFQVINNAINIDTFMFNEQIRQTIRKSEKISKEELVIGNVGRFMPQKNQSYLIDVFYEIIKKQPKAKLLIIGTGPLLDKIMQKIKNYKIEDKVIIKQNLTNVNEYMQAMDVFVLTSLYEGLPVVGIEAQAAGLPCVFSNTITSEVKITENVQFIDLKEKDKWINNILKLNFDIIKRNIAGKNIIENGYEIKTASRELENKYIQLFENMSKN